MVHIYLEKSHGLANIGLEDRVHFYYLAYDGHGYAYFYFTKLVENYGLKYFQQWGNIGVGPFWPVHYNTEKCSGMIKDIDFILDNFVEVTEKFPVPEKGSIDWDIEDANPSGLPDNQFGKPGMLLFLHKLKWLCEKAIEKDEDLLIDAD